MASNVNLARLAALVVTSVFASGVYAVDFLEAAPKQTRVLVENDKVRVIEANFRKGDRVPMHSHPDVVVYILKAGKTHFTDADGKTTASQIKDGMATFRPATTHSHEHLEDTRAIVIELKR